MFPCPQAKEPYEHNKKIKATLDKLNDRTFYTPTSILTESNKTVHNLSRQDYNIPESAFIIAYFGRHNKIKGFDIFRDIVSKALEANPNLYVLCAGSGEISSLRHPRWIELGFVSNVKDIMPLCDLYVLPNRETYFDLVVIEALRAGLVLNVSLTGGNKYFKTLPTSGINGIYYFDIN
jgi:glycosyltransferase involved in cell wall biosynthesis